jgi:hypothetical protein
MLRKSKGFRHLMKVCSGVLCLPWRRQQVAELHYCRFHRSNTRKRVLMILVLGSRRRHEELRDTKRMKENAEFYNWL